MEHLQSQEGHPFTRAVAQYIRQHEKALANSLQMTVRRPKASQNIPIPSTPPGSVMTVSSSSTGTLAAALSFAGLSFKSHTVKSAQLTLTPHHLFYLLSQIEELDVNVGPMNIRTESLHSDASGSNYVSFLQSHKSSGGRSDADSIHSVSSVRSVMSGMSALWSSIGLSSGSSKSEKARLALETDMKYIYGAFTKLPALRLTPDHRTPLIKGYEQFPFDTAVPLFAFKNLQQLEIVDLDFRRFHGWDRLAEQLCLLTIKRGCLDDPIDLLESIVLDDAEKRRRRSNRAHGSTPPTLSWSTPSTPRADYAHSQSDSSSPQRASLGSSPLTKAYRDGRPTTPSRPKRSHTMVEGTLSRRPAPVRPATSYRHSRSYSKAKRSGSGSSDSSDHITTPSRSDVSTNVNQNVLPASKWQKLMYLSLADNGLRDIHARSVQPVATSLRSFNLSSNLFTGIPESLARLSKLVSLDLSNCMIGSLQTLTSHPLPGLKTLKLKSNRLTTLAGIEALASLENLNVQDNRITDPDEAASLAQIPRFRKVWIKHNPLTKSSPDYRIRIMNHFRKVPGFVEDIVIDDQPAFYSERKQLIDRVMAIEYEPSALPLPPQLKVVLLQEPTKKSMQVLESNNALTLVTKMERAPSTASRSREKSARRRIVDLSADDAKSPIQAPKKTDLMNAPAFLQELTPVDRLESRNQGPLASLVIPPPSSAEDDETDKTLTNNSPTGEDYRRNIEELRQKFGNSWLSDVDSQHTLWQPNTDVSTLQFSSQPPKLLHYHSTPSAINTGGDLP